MKKNKSNKANKHKQHPLIVPPEREAEGVWPGQTSGDRTHEEYNDEEKRNMNEEVLRKEEHAPEGNSHP